VRQIDPQTRLEVRLAMSAPMGAGRSVEIPLQGYVTLQDVCSHVGEIWRRARQQQGLIFALDCSGVLEFSTLALTALGRLRKHLREFGCELTVVKCSPSVLERQDHPLLAPLLTMQPPPAVPSAEKQQPRKNRLQKKQDKAHAPQSPHYIERLVKVYQRYWLN
jgi:anti-anti-sigma regulatory factor